MKIFLLATAILSMKTVSAITNEKALECRNNLSPQTRIKILNNGELLFKLAKLEEEAKSCEEYLTSVNNFLKIPNEKVSSTVDFKDFDTWIKLNWAKDHPQEFDTHLTKLLQENKACGEELYRLSDSINNCTSEYIAKMVTVKNFNGLAECNKKLDIQNKQITECNQLLVHEINASNIAKTLKNSKSCEQSADNSSVTCRDGNYYEIRNGDLKILTTTIGKQIPPEPLSPPKEGNKGSGNASVEK